MNSHYFLPVLILLLVTFLALSNKPIFAQQIQYDFQVWPVDPMKATGFWDVIQGRMCPSPVPDQNTPVFIKVYFGLPPWAAQQAGKTQVVRESEVLPMCDKTYNITSIRPNFTGTYPIYAIAQWTQNGKVQTVQSNNTLFQAAQNCNFVYDLNLTRAWYHPDDKILFDVKNPDIDCLHQPSTVWLSIYNGSEDSETNMLYQKSSPILNETWFNYTVPAWTDKNGIFHFTAQLAWPDKDSPYKSNNYTFTSTDTSKTVSRSYDITMWVDPSSTVSGWPTFAQAKICPFTPQTDEGRNEKRDPVTGLITDPGSDILLTYHLTLPDGSQKLVQDTMGANLDCNQDRSSRPIYANMTGTWSVYVMAQWVENGTMHTVQTKQVSFDVRKPIFQSNNVQQTNITNIVAISHPPTNSKAQFDVLDWSQDGKSLLIEYDNYQNPDSSITQLAIMNIDSGKMTPLNLHQDTSERSYLSDARFSPDGRSIYFTIDGNLYVYDISNKTYSQLAGGGITKIQVLRNGDLAYSQKEANQNDTINVSFKVWSAYANGTKIKSLLEAQNIESFALSPDGKNVALVTIHGGGCEYCSYALAQVVNLDTNQFTTISHIFEPVEAKWSPAGDLIVWHSVAGGEAPGGTLTITDQIGGFQENIFTGINDPHSFVISPDGSSIIYGLNSWSCCASSQSLYRLYLAKPIPEFPFAIPVLLIGVTSLIVFYRMKFRQLNS